MKSIGWTTAVVCLLGPAAWIVRGPVILEQALPATLAGLFFLAAGLGGLWMVYVVIRHEPKPLPYAFVAFIPFVFVWYYFTRYKAKTINQTTD
jgi:hypothetical protein